jgi:hypothetical protein
MPATAAVLLELIVQGTRAAVEGMARDDDAIVPRTASVGIAFAGARC